MDLGSRITQLSKAKNWSHSQLAKNIKVSREIISGYERNVAAPPIDLAKRMTEALDVSLYYLVGNAEQKIDKVTLNRIQEINELKDSDKKLVYAFLDAFITKSKLQGVL